VNTPLSFGFLILGLATIIGGIIWIARLSSSEEDDNKTVKNGESLISVGFGEYDTEGLVIFRGVVVIILGMVSVVIGILL
jgi:hypothetical protein